MKVFISTNAAGDSAERILERHTPRKHNVVTVFLVKESGKERLFVLPEQTYNAETGAVDIPSKVSNFLDSMRDSLDEPSSSSALFKVWVSSNKKQPYEIINDLELKGNYHVNEVSLSPREWQTLTKKQQEYMGSSGGAKAYREKKYGEPQPATQQPVDHPTGSGPKTDSKLYLRLRYTWKEHNGEFNDWERKFVKSIGEQLGRRKHLSKKQMFYVKKIFTKYNVPFNAKASNSTEEVKMKVKIVANENDKSFKSESANRSVERVRSMLLSLERLLSEGSPLEKQLSQQLGRDMKEDFKSLSMQLDDLSSSWDDIEMDLEELNEP